MKADEDGFVIALVAFLAMLAGAAMWNYGEKVEEDCLKSHSQQECDSMLN